MENKKNLSINKGENNKGKQLTLSAFSTINSLWSYIKACHLG